MIALIVKGGVRYNDIRRVSMAVSFGFLARLLLRSDHYEGKLTG